MALAASGLSAAIKTELLNQSYVVDDQKLQDFCDAIGQAVISYLVANTVVTTISGAPNSEHVGIIS